MRWKQTQLDNHRTRIRSGFLFVPRCINKEWRWLERAMWEQKFCGYYDGSVWDDIRWIEPVVVKSFDEMAVKNYEQSNKSSS